MYQVFQYTPLIISMFKDTANFNINGMESNKEVISKLKFIGKVQKGEKINVRHMFVQPEEIVTTISRTLIHQDNRQNTLNLVRSIINRTIEIISEYSVSNNDTHRLLCPKIIVDLRIARNGLINLKDTYLEDVKFCCDMDTILQDVDTKLLEIEATGETESKDK